MSIVQRNKSESSKDYTKMSLTPKTNIPSLFNETKMGLTPRADYKIADAVAGDNTEGSDSVAIPAGVVRRIKQKVNDTANKGVNS